MHNDLVAARLFVNGEVWSLSRSNEEKEEADVKLFLQAITSKRRLDWHLFDTDAMAGRSSNIGDNKESLGNEGDVRKDKLHPRGRGLSPHGMAARSHLGL